MNSELEQPNRFTPEGMPVEEFRKLYRAYEMGIRNGMKNWILTIC